MPSYHICVVNLFILAQVKFCDRQDAGNLMSIARLCLINFHISLAIWNSVRSSLIERRSVFTSYCSFFLDLGPLARIFFLSVFLSFSVIFRSCPAGLGRFVFWVASRLLRPFLEWLTAVATRSKL